MSKEELISKKDLLRKVRISYGTLYRWKRMRLIPETWFIHKATRTGQATFFPKERMLARVGRIQELKKQLTAVQLSELFSANVQSFKIPIDDFVHLDLVSKTTLKAFTSVYPKKETLVFNDVFSMYVVDHLMQLSKIYLEDAKQVLRVFNQYLSHKESKGFQLILVRKMGVLFTLMVFGEEEVLFEDGAEMVAKANLEEFEEALKDHLLA